MLKELPRDVLRKALPLTLVAVVLSIVATLAITLATHRLTPTRPFFPFRRRPAEVDVDVEAETAAAE